jgi:hypothetical protein
MSWDEIYKKLEDELGHKPNVGGVQNKILEMLGIQNQKDACSSSERR